MSSISQSMSDQETTRLALAAVDEAFQDKIKDLSVILHRSQVEGGDGASNDMLPRTMNGIAIARKVRDTLRKAISEGTE